MKELTLLEKQSKENISKIYDTYEMSSNEASKLNTLSLDATLFDGHIDLKDFHSLTNLYIYKPFNKINKDFIIISGITSLDLSSNKDFSEVYIGPNTMPNLNSMTLSHSQQIEAFYFGGGMNVLKAFRNGTEEAFFRNMITRINAEPNKKIKALLESILKNRSHIATFNRPEDKEYQDFLKSRLLNEFGQNVLA